MDQISGDKWCQVAPIKDIRHSLYFSLSYFLLNSPFYGGLESEDDALMIIGCLQLDGKGEGSGLVKPIARTGLSVTPGGRKPAHAYLH